ncbi:uncharacterized protein LOC144372748 [Ictidomys tridecemlineatus]
MASDWPSVGACCAPIGRCTCLQMSGHLGSRPYREAVWELQSRPGCVPVREFWHSDPQVPLEAIPVGTHSGSAPAPRSLPSFIPSCQDLGSFETQQRREIYPERSVKGSIGAPGIPGMNGQKGEPRLPGTVGQNGIPGPKGEPGEQGEKGDTGESGPKGDTGKRENLENLVVQGKRENQVSLVLRGNQAYQDYQEQKVNVGRQGLLEEVSEGILEPLDQRGNKVNQELEAQRGPRGDRGDKGDSGALGPRGPPGQKGDQGATEIIDYNGNLHEALQVPVWHPMAAP